MTKEYNSYITKQNLILRKLNEFNIDKSILKYLENEGINIDDENVPILIRMIKRVIFDFNMYGKDITIKMMKDNDNYLFNHFTNGDKDSIAQLKNSIHSILKKSKIRQDINNFIVSSAININQVFYTESQGSSKKYVYAKQ